MYNDNANKNQFNYITLFVQNKNRYVTNMLKIYKHWDIFSRRVSHHMPPTSAPWES